MLSKKVMFSVMAGFALTGLATSSQAARLEDCRQDYLQIYGFCVHAPLTVGYQNFRADGADVVWGTYSELEANSSASTEVPMITITVNGVRQRDPVQGSKSGFPLYGLKPKVTYSISLCADYSYDELAYCTVSSLNIPGPVTPPPPGGGTTPPPGPTKPDAPKPPVYEVPENPKILAVEPIGNTGTVRVKFQCGKNTSSVETWLKYQDPGIGNGDNFYFNKRIDGGSCAANSQQESVVPFASKPAGTWSYGVIARNGDKHSPGFADVLGSFRLPEHNLINPTLPVSIVGTKSVVRETKYKVALYDQVGFGVVYLPSNGVCESGDAYHTVYHECMRMNLPDSYWQQGSPNFVYNPDKNIFLFDKSTLTPGVYYPAIGSACPYGGTRRGDRCQVASFSHVVLDLDINPQHNFSIDDNQNWPGLYGKVIEGVCPYGGVPASAEHCTISSLPDLRPGPHYWIDSSPHYKGIYYAAADRNCYLGGTYWGSGCRLFEFANAFENIAHGFYNLSNVEFEVFDWGQEVALSYRTIGNNKACYYGGGEKVGNRCVIKTFNDVDPQTNVWVDRNPAWPGVYYKAVNNQCIYGGGYGGGNCLIYRLKQPVPGKPIEPAPPSPPEEECGKPGVCKRN